jgi:hypothetical protein
MERWPLVFPAGYKLVKETSTVSRINSLVRFLTKLVSALMLDLNVDY